MTVRTTSFAEWCCFNSMFADPGDFTSFSLSFDHVDLGSCQEQIMNQATEP